MTSKQFKCTHAGCNRRFKSRSALGQHFRTQHVTRANAATINVPPLKPKRLRRRIVGLDMSLAAAITLPIVGIGAGVVYATYYYGGFDALLKALQ